LKAYKSFVPESFDLHTLLKYLLKRFPYHSESEWSQRIEEKQIQVNGLVISNDSLVRKGDEVSYLPVDLTRGEPPVNTNYSILFENNDFLVVNKPPNIPVHPAGRYRTQTLLTFLEKERGVGSCFPVHRLDRETSGVMIFAKQKSYQLMLQSLFEQRLVSKEYQIFVYGNFPKQVDAIGFIGKDLKSEIRKKQKFSFEMIPSFKEAATVLELISYDLSKNISYLKIIPKTGRIHQIRATLYSLGYPVVGDKLYGIRESAFLDFAKGGEDEKLSCELGHHRQALHASELAFYDPIGQKEYSFTCPLASDLNTLLVSK